MLKMIIADDERVIRETLASIVAREEGIQLTGLCKNGLEAYDMILDEAPDIVLTDIKMPGMSGIEMISRVAENDSDIQFILLSGYGEFDYAREAMRCGVRHYLLKPFEEEQIHSCLAEVIRECYHRRAFHSMEDEKRALLESFHGSVIVNMISEGIGAGKELDEIVASYEQYLDFDNTGYELNFIYYLEKAHLPALWSQVQEFGRAHFPGIAIHGIYVTNTLLFFHQSCGMDSRELQDFLYSLQPAGGVSIEVEARRYPDFRSLYTVLLRKLGRYGTISHLYNGREIPSCNYQNLIRETDAILDKIEAGDSRAFTELLDILASIGDAAFLKQIAGKILIKVCGMSITYSLIDATELMVGLENLQDPTEIRRTLSGMLANVYDGLRTDTAAYSPYIQQVLDYVQENISASNLTLKWICENHLYMNVDYVSKMFIRETGKKFSGYLADVRIQKAKELMAAPGERKIHSIAAEVGIRNNPKYFSQVFKKKTGMTPALYIKLINGDNSGQP